MPLRHIVLFRVRDGIGESQIASAIQALEALKVIPGLIEWTIRRSQDERKGVVVVQNSLFETRQALADFAAHPLHKVSADLLRTMADWWIGDYEEG
ncbi:MAG: Dabb family protein [Aeromicrobium sp.]